ncbi:hypothetical protein RGR602_CH03151 [Rhizobium gallicum bv. gallicum R602sp]|uniref:Uncharacterized protein n=1 Tax=Rhizobium gallicum bv. gallicum R602sp TaxID=1041138 RepID=A0A0B4X7C6_9HYPH|nr:hypothetical protein RGR602_CH03151 [Rhizobium gallicum bv. gallicum R602sp]
MKARFAKSFSERRKGRFTAFSKRLGKLSQTSSTESKGGANLVVRSGGRMM